MSMRIGATDLSNSLTVNAVFDSNTKLYRVTGTLVWAPSVSHDGEVLSCDVYHRETLGDVPQTVSLRELDVQGKYEHCNTVYSNEFSLNILVYFYMFT